MTLFSTLVLGAWIPLSLFLFSSLRPRRAVLVCYFVGWLFLPQHSIYADALPKIFALWKLNTISIGVMLGILVYDSPRLINFRPRWLDLPIAVFCASPVATSLSNDLGLWDGVCTVLGRVMIWGFPYLAGRLYFNDLRSLRELAVAVFYGGLVYVPFCLYEIRLSPQLHNIFYGSTGSWGGARLGGWRPQVFMQNGLALGLWMSASSLMGLWLARSRAIKVVLGYRANTLAVALVLVFLMCRSLGALAWFGMSGGALLAAKAMKSRLPILLFAAVPLTYMTVRTTNLWTGESLVEAIEERDAARAWSLEYRLLNEQVLVERALERPVLGWGGFSRSRVWNYLLDRMCVQDGLWIITLGMHGLVGLCSITCLFFLPIFYWVLGLPARYLAHPELAAGTALSVLLAMYWGDCLMNAMLNPLFTLVAGGISGVPWKSLRAWTPARQGSSRALVQTQMAHKDE